MSSQAASDIVIVGGGIAGLWLLNVLRQSGLSAILLESNALGAGQTYKSQGILHAGTKYALQGALTQEVTALHEAPNSWKKCLNGAGLIDLSNVPILSNKQYLWSPNKFTAKLTGFLASTFLNSQVTSISAQDYPTIFQHSAFKGQVYALDELIIDVPALIRELSKDNQDAIFKIEPLSPEGFKFDTQNQLASLTVYQAGKSIEITAQQFVLTAGAGNEFILKNINDHQVKMQRRPLHMVLAKLALDLPLYAHCLGIGNQPRITITTHYSNDGSPIWYLGGLLAEAGVHRDSMSQIKAAQVELAALFPWIDFSKTQFSTFMVDRAEPLQRNGLKPESSHMSVIHNMIVGWPTKLVLAPKLSEDIMKHFQQINLTSKLLDNRELRAWPMPPIAQPVWEEMFCKDVA